MRYRKYLYCAFAMALAAGLAGTAAWAEPQANPPPASPAPNAPANPQDPMHQCKLGCLDNCKTFANPGLRAQCVQSCNAKCKATYEPYGGP